MVRYKRKAAGWRRPSGSAILTCIAPSARRPELKGLRQPPPLNPLLNQEGSVVHELHLITADERKIIAGL